MKYKTIKGKQLFETTCEWCLKKYYAERVSSKTCSNKCRQGAYRGRGLVKKWREEEYQRREMINRANRP